MDRLDACELYLEKYPDERWGLAHIVLDDKNIEDYWLLRTANFIAAEFAVQTMAGNADKSAGLIKLLLFVLHLSDLPMPEGWEEKETNVDVHHLHVECGRGGCQYLSGIRSLQSSGKGEREN